MKYLKKYENINYEWSDEDLSYEPPLINEELIIYSKNFFREIWANILNIKINNKNLKFFYNNLLKEIYEPRNQYKYNNLEFISGVYNTGLQNDPPRSNVNFLNTNYTAFNYFINELNEYIYNGKFNIYGQINFKNNINDGLKTFFDILTEYKYEIFDNNSEILLELINIINNTKRKGEIAEDFTIEKLSAFDGITNILKSKDWGFKDDMLFGIDIRFTYNNKIKTVQVKSFENIILDENFYFIQGVSNPKEYKNIDLFAFYNHKNKDFYMFTNKNIEIENDSVIINKIYKRNI